MFDGEQVNEWHGQDVVDPEDRLVGRLEEVYRDNYGTSAGFACVKTGLFGRRLTFVPLEGATRERDHVRVAYLADQIKHAPSVEPDGALTTEEEAALFEYYGLNPLLESESYMAPQVPPMDPEAHVSRPLGSIHPESEFPPRAPRGPRLVRHYTREDAANIDAARQLTSRGALRDERYPGVAAGFSATDADRLSALEARVAELERSRGR